MKIEKHFDRTVIYLLDKKRYNENNLKDVLIGVFNELDTKYNFKFNDSYTLNLYINKYYGMILEIIYNDLDVTESNVVNLKLNILKDPLFLYQVDDPLDFINSEIYFYEDNFYVNMKQIDLKLLENSNIIYGNGVYRIIGRGIKI